MALIILVILLIISPFSQLRLIAKADGKSATIVMEAETGRVLKADNAQTQLPLASTTKIVTAITVIENTDTERIITIPNQAEGIEGSSIYVKSGQKWKLTDLLYGLMLRSGNDAAVALAFATAGGIEEFAALMNKTATNAGAFNSNFVNPHGLHDDEHYTTAYDLALITRYAMKSELFKEIVASKMHKYTDENGEIGVFYNKNKMLARYDGANGVKTGYTKQSGRCLVSSANREDMQLICVVLNVYSMWQTSAMLLDNCFSEYDMVTLAEKDKTLTYAKLRYNKGDVPVGVDRDLRYPLNNEEKTNVRYEYSTINTRLNNDKHLYMGKVNIYHNNYLLFSEKLFTI